MDRCIDFVWINGPLEVVASAVCFNTARAGDPSLYPSDHAGVCADLQLNA